MALLAVKSAGQFVEHHPERFGDAAFDLQHAGEAGEVIVFGGVQAILVSQKSEADAGGECSHGQRDPGKNRRPAESALKGGAHQDGERHRAGQKDGALESPARTSRERNEKIQKPECGRRTREQEEHRNRHHVCRERQLPHPQPPSAQARRILQQQQSQREPRYANTKATA